MVLIVYVVIALIHQKRFNNIHLIGIQITCNVSALIEYTEKILLYLTEIVQYTENVNKKVSKVFL